MFLSNSVCMLSVIALSAVAMLHGLLTAASRLMTTCVS